MGAWCADPNRGKDAWFQVSLGGRKRITGVATQGKLWEGELEFCTMRTWFFKPLKPVLSVQVMLANEWSREC